MNSTKKLKMNTYSSLINRLVAIVSGLILPRLILSNYGSETNGLVNSITQFLSLIVFLDLGLGSVVQTALYEPLAKNDNVLISKIMVATKKYFRKIAFFLIVYVLLLIIFYPRIITNELLDFSATALLIIAIAINSFARYYFGIVDELLLNADQRGYIQLNSESIIIFINIIVSSAIMINGYPIYIVKMATSFIYLLRPIYLRYYVKKTYDLNLNLDLKEDPLPQKWNGLVQHIAYSINNNTDIVLITLMSTLENVSIYSVYNIIVHAIRTITSSFTTGLPAFFGRLLANKEIKLLNNYFTQIEWLIHNLVVFLYGMTAVLIVSFVKLYTYGVSDVNYTQPLFGVVLALAGLMYSIRIPYQSVVFAAGHYKETQSSSFIEALLNIFISAILIHKLQIVGVAIGSLIAMMYRGGYLAYYLSKHILHRDISLFAKQFSVDLIMFLTIYLTGTYFFNLSEIQSILEWMLKAFYIGLHTIVVILFWNFIFYNQKLKSLITIYINKVFMR